MFSCLLYTQRALACLSVCVCLPLASVGYDPEPEPEGACVCFAPSGFALTVEMRVVSRFIIPPTLPLVLNTDSLSLSCAEVNWLPSCTPLTLALRSIFTAVLAARAAFTARSLASASSSAVSFSSASPDPGYACAKSKEETFRNGIVGRLGMRHAVGIRTKKAHKAHSHKNAAYEAHAFSTALPCRVVSCRAVPCRAVPFLLGSLRADAQCILCNVAIQYNTTHCITIFQ